MNRFTKIAAATGAVAALALPTSQAFAASKTENALIGAVVGAIAGGVLTNGDTTGIVGGAAAGALVGAATDKPDRYRSSRYVRTAPVYQSRYYAPRQDYRTYRSAQPAYRTGYYAPSYRYGY